MTTSHHLHPLDGPAVDRARDNVLPAAEAQRLAELLAVLAEPTRSRILLALVGVDELCVGDLALVLDINEDQASYALKQLRTSGLVASRRAGRVVYCRLAEGFPHLLLEHCLRELLTITTAPSRTAPLATAPPATEPPATGPRATSRAG